MHCNQVSNYFSLRICMILWVSVCYIRIYYILCAEFYTVISEQIYSFIYLSMLYRTAQITNTNYKDKKD